MSTGDWTPRRRGALYCSPACGGGCTMVAYREAVARASALAKKAGTGWTIKVSENLGWHYKIEKGVSQLHEHRHGRQLSYTLLVNTVPQLVEQGKTPSACLQAAARRAKAISDEMQYLLTA